MFLGHAYDFTPFLDTCAYVFGDKVTALPRVETGTYVLGGQTYGFTPVLDTVLYVLGANVWLSPLIDTGAYVFGTSLRLYPVFRHLCLCSCGQVNLELCHG